VPVTSGRAPGQGETVAEAAGETLLSAQRQATDPRDESAQAQQTNEEECGGDDKEREVELEDRFEQGGQPPCAKPFTYMIGPSRCVTRHCQRTGDHGPTQHFPVTRLGETVCPPGLGDHPGTHVTIGVPESKHCVRGGAGAQFFLSHSGVKDFYRGIDPVITQAYLQPLDQCVRPGKQRRTVLLSAYSVHQQYAHSWGVSAKFFVHRGA